MSGGLNEPVLRDRATVAGNGRWWCGPEIDSARRSSTPTRTCLWDTVCCVPHGPQAWDSTTGCARAISSPGRVASPAWATCWRPGEDQRGGRWRASRRNATRSRAGTYRVGWYDRTVGRRRADGRATPGVGHRGTRGAEFPIRPGCPQAEIALLVGCSGPKRIDVQPPSGAPAFRTAKLQTGVTTARSGKRHLLRRARRDRLR